MLLNDPCSLQGDMVDEQHLFTLMLKTSDHTCGTHATIIINLMMADGNCIIGTSNNWAQGQNYKSPNIANI